MPESMESHWRHVHDRVGGMTAGAALGQEPPKQTIQAIRPGAQPQMQMAARCGGMNVPKFFLATS